MKEKRKHENRYKSVESMGEKRVEKWKQKKNENMKCHYKYLETTAKER